MQSKAQAKAQADAQAKPAKDQKREQERSSKTGKEYIRILLLVGVIVVLAIISSLYIGSHKGCSSIAFSSQRNSCFDSEALSSGNATACLKISQVSLSDECISAVAESTANVSLCSSLPAGQLEYSCISNVSITESNETYCNSITNSSYKSECLYSFAKAMNFSNPSYCSGISIPNESAYCDGISYYAHAYSTGNASYCSILNATAGEGVPLSALLKAEGQNSSLQSLYELSLLNISDRGLCYYTTATKFKNASLCGMLSGPIASYCSSSLNVTTAKEPPLNLTEVVSKCDSISVYGGSVATDACFIGFAISYHNSTYCGQISNSTTRANCESEVSQTSANSTA
ncbi:MAG: hypothetical protein M1544_03865 [Candidatus Marsarchaeota archaeon]|nr:hypothetical protein [Candidatus Marsarchaeota archaeon]